MRGLRAIAVFVTAAVTGLTLPAAADEPTPATAPAAATASAGPQAAASAPSPAGGQRAWLAHPQATEMPTRPPSAPWRPLAVVAFMAALGGAGVFARRRWKGVAATPDQPRLRVLDSVRLGDKSHLVVAQVGGRSLLLGVTAHSVRRIAWLKPSADAPAAAPPVVEDESIRDGFASVLRKSFGYAPVAPAPESEDRPKPEERMVVAQNAASIIAARTRDTVDVASRPTTARKTERSETGPEGIDPAVVSMIEGQVSGLRKRRR